jgi:hypothetical protein
MMNLEVLFHSADLTGNSTLRQIAMTHADTTMKNHIRADGAFQHADLFGGALSNFSTIRVYLACCGIQFDDGVGDQETHIPGVF